jgi:pimeloyl-ACP methyl ester carboxylesterase
MIHDIKDATQNDNVPIVLIDLPHVSLRMYDEIPNIKSQTRSISRILDLLASKIDRNKCKMNKVTLVGHSYGTAVMSWLVQSQPERIAGCVFLGKYCHET